MPSKTCEPWCDARAHGIAMSPIHAIRRRQFGQIFREMGPLRFFALFAIFALKFFAGGFLCFLPFRYPWPSILFIAAVSLLILTALSLVFLRGRNSERCLAALYALFPLIMFVVAAVWVFIVS